MGRLSRHDATSGKRGGNLSPGWLRLPRPSTDVSVKPPAYLPLYEDLLAPLRDQSFSLLELGVWRGDSLEMWRGAFPRATIVGVDLGPPDIDLGPRVHIITGDQTDGELLGKRALSTIANRASLFRFSWVGAWAIWLLGAAMLAAVVACGVAISLAAREDDRGTGPDGPAV